MGKYAIGVDFGTQSGRAVLVEPGTARELAAAVKQYTHSVMDKVYRPIPENVAMYEKLYREYEILHDYFGRGANDAMKRLKTIREEQSI
jgi:ribulose kinase